MRRGEIFNLKWSNIDFEHGFIELLQTKSGKARKIPLSDSLSKELNKLPQESDYVFINKQTGLPYTTFLYMVNMNNRKEWIIHHKTFFLAYYHLILIIL